MLSFLVALALLGADEGSAPADEYLYLTSHFDTDGFAPRGAKQGDLDGQGNAFPEDALPNARLMEIVSARLGTVRFLRPPLKADAKNLVTMRGQTIRVRTKRQFNVLLFLGAAHAPARPEDDDPRRFVAGRSTGATTCRKETSGTGPRPAGRTPVRRSNPAGRATPCRRTSSSTARTPSPSRCTREAPGAPTSASTSSSPRTAGSEAGPRLSWPRNSRDSPDAAAGGGPCYNSGVDAGARGARPSIQVVMKRSP